MIIAVIGGRECSQEEFEMAREVGREIARRGAMLVCGGLGGIMEAAAMGAFEENGVTIGILPGRDPRQANPYIKIPIPTNLGFARNVIVVLSGQAVIAVGGSYGTLSEIALALAHGIPVVGLKTWSFSRDGKADPGIVYARTPSEAVSLAIAAIQEGRCTP